MPSAKKMDKADRKKTMPFIQSLKKILEAEGANTSLERKMSFDEVYVLKEMIPWLKKSIEHLQEVVIIMVDPDGKGTLANDAPVELSSIALSAEPGLPAFEFCNI